MAHTGLEEAGAGCQRGRRPQELRGPQVLWPSDQATRRQSSLAAAAAASNHHSASGHHTAHTALLHHIAWVHVPTLCDEVMRCVQCGARWHCDGWMLLLLLLMMIASWWPGQKAREPVGHVTPGAFFLSGSQRPLPQAPCVPSPVLALFTLSHSTGQHCPSQSPLDQESLFPFYRRKTGFKGEAARRTLTTKLFTAVPLKE